MNFAILLCGGSGLRMGKQIQIPKQYIKIRNKHIFSYCLDVILKNALVDIVIICAHENWRDTIRESIDQVELKKEILYADPGESRQMSVYNSIKIAQSISSDESDLVVIHDGARPLINDDIINDCFNVSKKYDGAIAAIPVFDTVYQSDDGETISSIPKRDTLRNGQTPEAFRLKMYYDIHQKCTAEAINSVTGGAEFAANNGMEIGFSRGDTDNIKITTKKDLELFQDLIKNYNA